MKQKCFRKQIMACLLALSMIFGIVPIQAFAAEQPQLSLEEIDDMEIFNRPADRFDLADVDSWQALDGELLRDPSSISQDDRLRILSQISDITRNGTGRELAGVYGFDDGFSDNPDEVIDVIVQFVTPPYGVLRHMPQETSRARTSPEAEALAAHAAFYEQLGGIAIPFSVNSPIIDITGSMHTLFNGVIMRVSAGLVNQIAALPEVFAVMPDYEIFSLSEPQDFDEGLLDGLITVQNTFAPPHTSDFMQEAIDVLRVEYIHHNLGFTGAGIKVAVIDTGIDYRHPRLAGNFAGGWDFIRNNNDPMEATYVEWQESGLPFINNNGRRFITDHGSHVAGTILAIAPDAEIYAYRVLGPYGSGSISNGMLAIERAFLDGVHVMNMSLGAAINAPFEPLAYVTNVASLNGIVMVTSAGNTGTLGYFSVGMPGVASLAITVGAASYGGFGYHGYPNAETNGMPFEVAIIGWAPGDSFGDNIVNNNDALTTNSEGFFTYVYLGGGTQADFDAAGNLEGRIAVISRGATPFGDMRTRAVMADAGALLVIDNRGPRRSLLTVLHGESTANLIPSFIVAEDHSVNFSRNVGDTGLIRLNELSNRLPADKSMGAFSSLGPVRNIFHIKPDMVAPGVNIVSTVPNFTTNPDFSDIDGWDYAYAMHSGTSMAGPMVAGAATLLVQSLPNAEPAEIKARLMNTASMDYLAHDNFSVYHVGAGFLDIVAALTQTSFATVETYIPWLGDGVTWTPGILDEPSWRRETLSSLNFGTVTDIVTRRSETLTVELSDSNHWDVEIIYNSNNFSQTPIGDILRYERTAEGIDFWLQFGESEILSRVYEGLVILTSGSYRITMPFAAFYGDGQPNPQPRPGMGIVRPIITSRDEPGWSPQPVHSSFSAVMIGFNEPLGGAIPFRFIASPIMGSAFDNNDAFYFGTANVQANANVAVPRAVSVFGYNLRTEQDETLPEGVYELIAEGLSEHGDVIVTFELGRFIVDNSTPEITLHHYNHTDSSDPDYPHVYSVVYNTRNSLGDIVFMPVRGQITSRAHDLAQEFNVTTIRYLDSGGNPRVYGNEFALIIYDAMRIGTFANEDGSFTMNIPYSRLSPFTVFGDARLSGNYVIVAESDDFIRIPVGTLGNIDTWATIGNVRSEFFTTVFMLEEQLKALAWNESDSTLSVGLDRFTPDFDVTDFEFELIDDQGVSHIIAPYGFTANWQNSSIVFEFPQIVAAGQLPITLITPDITAPVGGESPATSIDDQRFTSLIEWYPNHNVFHFDTDYTATVTLWASGGSPFAQNIMLNVSDGTISNVSVREDGLHMTFDIEYGPTESLDGGQGLIIMRVPDNPTGDGRGPFGNNNDQSLFLDSTATMIPILREVAAGVRPMPDDFWESWDIWMPYYYWDNPLGGFIVGTAGAIVDAGLYDWYWASFLGRNTLGFDSILVRDGEAHFLDLWVDLDNSTFGIDHSIYTMVEVAVVDTATSRTPILGNQGGESIVTFRGIMPEKEVGVFLNGVQVTEPWATTDLIITGTPVRYDVTINFPANTTNVPIEYVIRMSDADGGWLDTSKTITISDVYISRPGMVDVTVSVGSGAWQFLVDSTATANAGISNILSHGNHRLSDYNIFLPYFLEDNRIGAITNGNFNMQLPAGRYDITLGNMSGTQILTSNFFHDIPLIYGHHYRFGPAGIGWTDNRALWVDDVLAPRGRVAVDIPIPKAGEPLPSTLHYDAFTVEINWNYNHTIAQHGTIYTADVILHGNPGMYMGGITRILIGDDPSIVQPVPHVRDLVVNDHDVTFRVIFPPTDIEDEPGMVRLTVTSGPHSMIHAAHRLMGWVLAIDSTAQAFPLPPSAISPQTGRPFFAAVRNLDMYDMFFPADPTGESYIFAGSSGSVLLEPGVIYDIALLGRGEFDQWAGAANWNDNAAEWAMGSPLYGILRNVVFEYGYRYEIEMPMLNDHDLILRKFDLQTGERVPWIIPDIPNPPPPGPPVPTSVVVTPSTASVMQGEDQAFAAVVRDQRGQDMSGHNFDWSITGQTSATTSISSQGLLTLGADESATSITVRADLDSTEFTLHGTATVTVLPMFTPSSIEIAPKEVDVEAGEAQTFTATVYDQGSTAMTNVPLVWSISGNTSTDTSITQQGVLTLGDDETVGGKIIVRVEVQGYTAVYDTAEVTVLPPWDGNVTLSFVIRGNANFMSNMFGLYGWQFMVDTTATAFPLQDVSWNNIRNSNFDITFPNDGSFMTPGPNVTSVVTHTIILPAGTYDIAFISVGNAAGDPPPSMGNFTPDADVPSPGAHYGYFNNHALGTHREYRMVINLSNLSFAWETGPLPSSTYELLSNEFDSGFALPYEAYIAYEALVEEIYVPEPVIPMFPDVDMSLYEIDFSQVQYGDYYEVQSDELEYVDVSNSDDGFNFIRLNEIRPTVNRATRSGVARLNVTLHDITLSVELNNLATEPIQLPAPSDLAINGTILTWVGVATTWSYQIYVNGEPTGGLVSENTFDLATLNLSTASYEIRVRAIGDDILHLDSELSEAVIFNSESNLARLTAPIGLAITTNSVLTWNAVLQATAYRVYVNGNPHDSTVTSTSFDLASLGLSPGNHQIRVRALGNGSDILDSLLSETVIFTISGIPTTLTAPTGLAIANSLLTWNAVPQATAYRVYINGNPHGITAIATTFNLNTLGLSEGSYEISVRALGNGVNILDSALSNAITFAVAPQPPAESGAGGGWASVMQTPPPAQTPPTQTPPPAWRPNPTPPLSTPMFDDINPQAWYADYVEVVTSMGIFHGVSSSQFAPSSNMTRAMFVQVLANLNGVNTLDFTARPQNFNDVSRNAWYFGAVKWASENGIVVGIGDGNFAPNQSITREEMAVMLYRFIEFVQLELPTGARRTFVDQGSISSWATEAVTTIQAMGIIMGRPDGTFDPQATATRAEVAAIFARFIYIVE